MVWGYGFIAGGLDGDDDYCCYCCWGLIMCYLIIGFVIAYVFVYIFKFGWGSDYCGVYYIGVYV